MSYIVIGRFCSTDANPVKDIDERRPVVEVGARTREEADSLACWYRDRDDPSRAGQIVERRP